MEETLIIEEKKMEEREIDLMPSVSFLPDKNVLGDRDINYIVLAVDYEKINTGKSTYDVKLLGKSMLDWVKSACTKEPKVKKVCGEIDVVSEIKDLLDESEWTIVLFSDTPLLTNDTVERSFNFAENSGLNVCMLKRGYIFKTDYVKRIEGIYGVEVCEINSDEFMVVDDFVKVGKAVAVLKNRVLDFHSRNGVFIVDRNSTYIDSEVSIGSGTIVYPGNYIYGSSEIGEDVQLFSGNRILNSIIANSAKIECSNISSSVIGE